MRKKLERKRVDVLVDSSVWIAASNPRTTACLHLKSFILRGGPIVIAKPIQMEVCQGAKTTEQFKKLWESFLGFPILEVTDQTFELAAWNYFRCRRKGLTLSSMDCLIATLSLQYRVALWSEDKIFQKLEKTLGLSLFSI